MQESSEVIKHSIKVFHSLKKLFPKDLYHLLSFHIFQLKNPGMKRPSLLKNIWLPKLLDKNFRTRFFISIIILSASLFSIAKFLAYNETREGFSFNDPVLNLFTPVDLTWLTFVLIYASLIVALYSISFNPEIFITALQSYALIMFLRLITIYLLPLNAPTTIIPLTDPFVEFFGGGQTLYRDLFFSGHTATMFLFYLTNQNKKLRRIFFTATIIVGVCVLIQHVHYTIDVLAAPFFTYTSYRIAVVINDWASKK